MCFEMAIPFMLIFFSVQTLFAAERVLFLETKDSCASHLFVDVFSQVGLDLDPIPIPNTINSNIGLQKWIKLQNTPRAVRAFGESPVQIQLLTSEEDSWNVLSSPKISAV